MQELHLMNKMYCVGYLLYQYKIKSQAYLVLGVGIPDKENGKIIGWKVALDAATLRFMIEKYGVRRGLGDKLDITSNGNSINTGFKIEVIDKREDVRTEEEEN